MSFRSHYEIIIQGKVTFTNVIQGEFGPQQMMGWNTNSSYKVRAGQHSIEQMGKLGQGNQLKNQLAKLHADQYYHMYRPSFSGVFFFQSPFII